MRKDSQLTDFHIRLEGKHCSQDEPPSAGNQRQPDFLQQMEGVLTAVQQVQTADHIVLETSVLPLIDPQQPKHHGRTEFFDDNSLFLGVQEIIVIAVEVGT